MQAISQAVWVNDTEQALRSSNRQTVDALKTIYKKGTVLVPGKGKGLATPTILAVHVLLGVEAVLMRIKKLLTDVQEWEQKIKSALKEK